MTTPHCYPVGVRYAATLPLRRREAVKPLSYYHEVTMLPTTNHRRPGYFFVSELALLIEASSEA